MSVVSMQASDERLSPLVNVEWLAANIDQPDVIVLDASWHMPNAQRDGEQEWLQARIPGAQFFDFDRKVCDQNSHLPHMLPDVETFSREVQKLGVNQHSRIVIYDAMGVFSGARAWWMFRVMGHDNVTVLNGGLPAWKRVGMVVESGESLAPVAGDFTATLMADWVKDTPQVEAALADPAQRVVDARSIERFKGLVDEPRAGLRRGGMPGALNLPFVELHDESAGFEAVSELREIFAEHGLKQSDVDQPLIFSCGSGVTACVLALAAEVAGFKQLSVYDGSWTEWGQLDSGLPVVTS